MFEQLGGPDVRAVAERFFSEPTRENRDEYQRVCLPHYVQRPLPPELISRVTRRDDVSEHFFRGELLRFDLTPRLDRIGCPVFHLAGELDPIVTIEDSEELAAALPAQHTKTVRFPGAGHMLAIEQPDVVLAIVRDFVLQEPYHGPLIAEKPGWPSRRQRTETGSRGDRGRFAHGRVVRPRSAPRRRGLLMLAGLCAFARRSGGSGCPRRRCSV